MRRIPTPGKRYPFRLYFPELDEIDQICTKALEQFKLLPSTPERIRIDRFLEKRFECPISFEELGSDFLGCCVFTALGIVQQVVISQRLGEDERPVTQRRLRSTCAHEAGHGLLHGCLFVGEDTESESGSEQIIRPERKFLCRESEIGTLSDRCYDGKWWEFQANRAIGGLLLPKSLVVEAVRPFAREIPPLGALVLDEQLRPAAVKALAEIFDVNMAVVRFRLQEVFPESPIQNFG